MSFSFFRKMQMKDLCKKPRNELFLMKIINSGIKVTGEWFYSDSSRSRSHTGSTGSTGSARRFRGRRAPRLLKLKPTFSQVLKTLNWLLNSKFITEIARNWLISSQFFSQEKTFYGASETMSVRSDHPRMTRTHPFNTNSYI